MELAITAGLVGAGYLLNQDRDNQRQTNNEQQISNNHPTQIERRTVTNHINQSRNPIESNVIPPYMNQNIHQTVEQSSDQNGIQYTARPDATRGSNPSQSTSIFELKSALK